VAKWNSERLQLVLKMSTFEEYVPALLGERDALLKDKRRMDAEAASIHFHVESLNDRCDALATECEGGDARLAAAQEREEGMIGRLNQAHERIEMLQTDLHQVTSELTKVESSQFSKLKYYEEALREKTLKLAALHTEVDLLKEGLEAESAMSGAASVGPSQRLKGPQLPLASQRSKPWQEGQKKVPVILTTAAVEGGNLSPGLTRGHPSSRSLKSVQSSNTSLTASNLGSSLNGRTVLNVADVAPDICFTTASPSNSPNAPSLSPPLSRRPSGLMKKGTSFRR
jgi:hypothetical protein